MKRILTLITLFTFLLFGLIGCEFDFKKPVDVDNNPPVVDKEDDLHEDVEEEEQPPIVEDVTEAELNGIIVYIDGLYTSKEEVALYIVTFGWLPTNYLNNSEIPGGKSKINKLYTSTNKQSYGGDIFGNRERLLPLDDPSRRYYESDIDYVGKSRGAKRIVFSNDLRVFYTDDHYGSFLEYDRTDGTWNSY